MIRLDLSVPVADFLAGEPIPLHLRLVNEGAERAVPFEPSSADVTTFVVLDERGATVARVDGYDQDRRLGLETIPIRHETLVTGTLPRGGAVAWIDDLSAFTGPLPPGAYAVEARFAFTPSGIRVSSARASFRVRPLRCASLDVLVDCVAMEAVHLVVGHGDGDDARMLVQVRSALDPEGVFHGAVLSTRPGSAPLVSEADFITRATYDHDFSRWIAWIAGDTLQLAPVRSPAPGPITAHPLGFEGVARLAGRPVQHEDGGVSVLVIEDREGAEARLHRLGVSAEGELRTRRCLATFTGATPSLTVTAADVAGQVHLLWAAAGALPLRWLCIPREGPREGPSEEPVESRVIPIEAAPGIVPDDDVPWAHRILGLRALAKGRPGDPLAVLSALSITHGTRRVFWMGAATIDGATPGPWRHDVVELDSDLLAPDETIDAADVARTAGGELHGIFVTSAGRIFHVAGGAVPRCVLTIAAGAASPRLLALDRRIYLVDADAQRGVAATLLARSSQPSPRK